MYICRNFKLEELVGPEVFKSAKGNINLWKCFDVRLLVSIDLLRDFLKTPVKINDWTTGGNFKESGLRSVDTSTGAEFSSHKFGRAADLKFGGDWSPQRLRTYMKMIGCFEDGFLKRTDEEVKPFLNIRRIEWLSDTQSWLHIDCFEEELHPSCIRIIRG